MLQAIDNVYATGQSFGEQLSSLIYAILYQIAAPGSSILFPYVSLLGLLMVVFALRARFTTGARSRGWTWAFWVTTAMSMVGFAQIFNFNKTALKSIGMYDFVFFEIVMLVFPFLILRVGTGTSPEHHSLVNRPAVTSRLAHPALTLITIIVAPVLLVMLASGILVQMDLITPLTPAQPLSDNPGIYLSREVFLAQTFFIGIAGFISAYVATRPSGQERTDLAPLARYLWFSAAVITSTFLVLHAASDFFIWPVSRGDAAAELAAFLSLILLAVTPGISPFRKFASGGFWRKTPPEGSDLS